MYPIVCMLAEVKPKQCTYFSYIIRRSVGMLQRVYYTNVALPTSDGIINEICVNMLLVIFYLVMFLRKVVKLGGNDVSF